MTPRPKRHGKRDIHPPASQAYRRFVELPAVTKQHCHSWLYRHRKEREAEIIEARERERDIIRGILGVL